MRRCGLLALVCVFISVGALAESPQSDNAHDRIHPVLAKNFAASGEQEKLRVIVSLADDLPPGLARKLAIAEQQDRVLGAFKSENNGAGLEVLFRYQTLNGFSASLNYGQARALSNHAEVEFIEEMPVHEKFYTESHPLTDVDLAQSSYDGSGAVIAFIDDGIDASHPAFADKLLGGYDFSDNDSDPTIGCSGQDHGTAVAGVALGNGGGALGVAPGAKMVFLKIQSSRRRFCGGSALDGDVVGAIDWVTANKDTYGIDIISMSLGGGLFSSPSSCDSSSAMYWQAVNNAVTAGITIIAASGNDGMCDSISRPACFSDVISVGAVYDDAMGEWGWCVNNNSCTNPSYNPGCPTGYGAVWEFSYPNNVIAYSNSAGFLDVTAPATCAKTVAPNNATEDCFGGTSSATPFTSGTAALVVEAAGEEILTPAEMREVLVNSGDPVTDPKNGRITPRINANLAVLAVGGTEPPDNVAPTAAFSEFCSYLDCVFTDNSVDSDGTISSWNWNFGDGKSSSVQHPNHVFAAAGTYTVTLTVTDDEGASDTASGSVTATDPVSGVYDLVGSSSSQRNRWTATVTDNNGSMLSGTWSESGTPVCSGSTCSLAGIRKNIGSVTFTTSDEKAEITILKP